MRRIAVILSGCGFQDGAEITESISALVSLSELGVHYEVFAPRMAFTAANHLTGEPTSGERDVLTEAARIARGKIQDIDQLRPDHFDAVLLPGGFGAAKNLCSWAEKGAACDVHPQVKLILETFHNESKPIGAICIAPAVVAKVLGRHHVALTIGDDVDVAKEIEKTGAHHIKCGVTDYVTDREHKIVSTPAYMYGDAKPHDVFAGIRKAVHELVEMA